MRRPVTTCVTFRELREVFCRVACTRRSLFFIAIQHPRAATKTKMKGMVSNELSGPERADLLCFLVLAQLIGRANTGDWLRTDHAVEATRMWAASNSAGCDWLERAKLTQMSAAIAPQFLVFPCFRDAREMVKLFVDRWRLDYRSPTVRGMLDVCTEHLRQE